MHPSAAIRYLAAILITLFLSIVIMLSMKLRLIGVDDANILFVYSKHLASGHGLVYNIGGERVEGFSSMLWMLASAVGYLVTDRPAALLFALNVLLIGGAIGYAWQTLHECLVSAASDTTSAAGVPTLLASLLFIAWVASSPGYFIWTVTSLMETGLWAALLLVATMLPLRMIVSRDIGAGKLAGFAAVNMLLLLTRPEAMAWVLYLLAMLLILLRAEGGSWTSAMQRWLPVAAACAACLAALIMFRLNYFGYPLPNTYYAKMTPDKVYDLRFGLAYLFAFFRANWLVGICLVAAIATALVYAPRVLAMLFGPNARIGRTGLLRFTAATTALVGLLVPVLMGGDIFGAFRFFQPAWPLLLFSVLLLPLPPRWRDIACSGRAGAVIAAAAFIAFSLTQAVRWPGVGEDRARVAHLYELTHRGVLASAYIQEIFASSDPANLPTVGASAAGGAKIAYPGIVIDTMGLNFTPMAHHAGDKTGERGHASFNKAIFWQYATDLVEPTLCPASGEIVNRLDDPGNWLYRIYRELFTDADFRREYHFVAIEAPASGGWLCTYMKRGVLAGLRGRSPGEIRIID